MLFSAALAMLITGCAQQTFTVGNKPTAVTPKETITHHFFVSEVDKGKLLMQPKFVAVQKNVVKTETQQTFVNGLLGFITLASILRWKPGYIATIVAHRYGELICTVH
ncbi:lipoprotein bor [Escherichia coli]|nr:lipoprotein bor [Escherichia coli]